MPKDLIAEIFASKPPEGQLPRPFVAGGATPRCKTSHQPVNRLEAVFAVYRDYKEYDYEDWQIARPSRSADLSKEVEATLLNSALRSLEYNQNSMHPTLWARIKRLRGRLSVRLGKIYYPASLLGHS